MSSQKHLYNHKKISYNIFTDIFKIIDYVYSEHFCDILIKEKATFINDLENNVLEILKIKYNDKEKYQKELTAFEKNKDSIKSRYESDFLLLNSEYIKYKKYPNKISFLSKYRKHCLNSEQVPLHKCSENQFGKFINVYSNNNIKNNVNNVKLSFSNRGVNNKILSYVICSECLTCYMASFIKIYCTSCNYEYYSSKLEEYENENILPATWKEYHCKPIIVNEVMKCVKCENILYINLITKKLVCLNKKCNFSSNPRSIVWKCKICKKDFRSSAKIFNPLESKVLQKEVWKSLLYKKEALPQKLFCCLAKEKNLNVKYFHDKKCKGELYKGMVDGKEIVICGTCHAVNFYEKFIWTCPICFSRFYYHGKKHQNENITSTNNLILKSSSKIRLKNTSLQKYKSEIKPNLDKDIIENEKESIKVTIANDKKPGHKHNYSTNIRLFTEEDEEINKNDENKNKVNNYENNFTIPYGKETKSLECQNLKKEESEYQKSIYVNSNLPKPKFFKKNRKVRYKTLFDILEEREKYKAMNQSRDEINEDNNNKINENLANNKNKMAEYFNKKRLKLLGQSKPQTSMKKDKKAFFHKFLIQREKTSDLIKNLINKPTKNKNEGINGNNLINISDSEEKKLSNFNEDEIHAFESFKKKLEKKYSSDFYNFSPRFVGISESKNFDIRLSYYKDKIFSKRYKDDFSIIANDDFDKKIKVKSSNKNHINKHKLNIDTKKNYLKESNNNTYKKNYKQNISLKKESDNNFKKDLTNHNFGKDNKYLRKSFQTNIFSYNENSENKNNDKIEIKKENNINEKNEINTNEIKNKNKKKYIINLNNSTKEDKNQVFKKIFINKIKQKNKKLNQNKNLNQNKKAYNLKDNINIKVNINELNNDNKNDEVKINEINNNNELNIGDNNNIEMGISPLGDIAENVITKEELLKIAKECKIPTFDENSINYIKRIGQGAYGIIYLVEEKNSKKQYALKSILCQDIEQILKHKKEFELCYSLNHSNLIKIYNVSFKYLDMTTYLLYVLMEKAETDWNTEIEKRIKLQNFYTENELIDIMKQLVSVLCYFQKNNIAHRDIKPQNILICDNNIFKITDLGEAKTTVNESQLATLKGSQLFMSPNLFFVLKYDGNGVKVKHNAFKSDVFSLGYCFLYAMSLDLKMIKYLREETAMIDVLTIIKRFEIDNKFSEKFMSIIYKMIQTDENKRCDFLELNDMINKNL